MGDGVSRHFRVADAAGPAEALWDIKSKRYQAPVWDLQGGRVRDKVRAMLLLIGSGRDELTASAQQAKRDGVHRREAHTVPLAAGERNHTIWEFGEYVETAGIRFVRPDVSLAGGITLVKKSPSSQNRITSV